MKLVKVISTHKKKATAGMVEAIVRLKDGTLATRHIKPGQAEQEPTETPVTPTPESN